MMNNRIVTREEWLAARKAHLAKEKELTRLRDQLSADGPNHDLTDWVRHHDRYDGGAHVAATGSYVPADGSTGTSA
jgi:predicted dithiol-disulfide oxidoreductase (DUF899 family)